MKTITKKSIVKKVKVEKSTLEKSVSKKIETETVVPIITSIKDIKKDSRSEERQRDPELASVGSDYSSTKEETTSGIDAITEAMVDEEKNIPNISESEEERKEKDIEELLPVSEVEKSNNHSYVLIVAGIIVVVTIFGAYKMFYSSQKNGDVVTSTVNQQAVIPTAEVSAPVEKITIVDSGSVAGSQKENITTATSKTFKDQAAFKSFSYDASTGKQIVISGTCHDKYYAFLVFDSKIDYRKDPGRAQINKAFSCPASGRFTIDVNLKDFNLQSGEYYVFIADQGATGSWYNPR